MKLCPGCGHPHPPQDECMHSLLSAIATLIRDIGSRALCSGCGVEIFFVTIPPKAKKRPYTIQGLPHALYCQKQDQIRAKSKQTPLTALLTDVE